MAARARTDTMDTRKILEPVVKERPARGREMVTQDFGEAESRGTDGPRSVKRGKSEVFHEGYVGGQKYLVPDSNLEAMADMINLKMRKMETTKYVNDREMLRDYETNPEEEYVKKSESLFKKLSALAADSDEEIEEEEEDEESTSLDNEESKEELAEPPSSEDEESAGEEEEESDIGEDEEESEEGEEEEKAKEEGGDETIESEDEEEEEPVEEDKPSVKELEEAVPTAAKYGGLPKDEEKELVPVYYHDPNIKRFLISGHFRSNKKPIFIVQQYEGPSVLGRKDPMFYSQKSEQDVDIFTCGEFYKESILEEDASMRPIGLNTSPRKVVIDWRSRVYEDKFNDIFVGSELDVQLVGSFIEHRRSAQYTPMISITVRKGSARAASNMSDQTAATYVMTPIVENLFEREDAWQTGPRKSGDKKKGNVTFGEGVGRIRTGFQYPEGAGATGPMPVYVTYPVIHVPPASPRSSPRSSKAQDQRFLLDSYSSSDLAPSTVPGGSPRASVDHEPSAGVRSSKTQAPVGGRRSLSDHPRSSTNKPRPSMSRVHGSPRSSAIREPSTGVSTSRAHTLYGVKRSSVARSDGLPLAAHAPFGAADGSGDDERSRETTSAIPQKPSVTSKLRDALRDTVLLPETTRPEGTAGLESPSARRRHIRNSLTAGDSPTEVLRDFIRGGRERRRERRMRERERVNMSTVLSQLLFPK